MGEFDFGLRPGADANDGSLAHPWATLEYALTQLSAGVINLLESHPPNHLYLPGIQRQAQP